jgi:hypothetical protein
VNKRLRAILTVILFVGGSLVSYLLIDQGTEMKSTLDYFFVVLGFLLAFSTGSLSVQLWSEIWLYSRFKKLVERGKK